MKLTRFFLISLASFAPSVGWACASCGCTLSTDWETSTSIGFKLDIRYDYINQSQLRSGASATSPAAASGVVNGGNPQEVERYTVNNYVTFGAEYTIDPSWKVAFQLPYINRSHSTLGTASDGTTAGAGGGQYSSLTSTMGDTKLIGSFQGLLSRRNLGAMLGVKLPTGSSSLTGTSTDPTSPGPVSIDRGLQPGTGTTDLIFGVYYSATLTKNLEYYTQDLYQVALYSSNGYRPGNSLNLNLGLRYLDLPIITPQAQLNLRNAPNDTGVNADTVSTGGTLLYFSPGVAAEVTSQMSLYSFVQIPIYQYLQGVQLAPTLTASFGARYLF